MKAKDIEINEIKRTIKKLKKKIKEIEENDKKELENEKEEFESMNINKNMINEKPKWHFKDLFGFTEKE